ncbi:MAG TPA: hypothetical protein GXX46_07695 [Peptococcaceae bacterium]|nr:hypothetical protein [Peptococcaceae bacterium]
MNLNLEELIEKLDSTRVSLENEINYAVMWLSETIDFLNNNNLAMAKWAFEKYLEVLNDIDIDLFKKTGAILKERLQQLSD